MNRERIDDWCEKGILGFVLAILVFGPLTLGGNRAWSFLGIEALTLAVMLFWIARLWIAEKSQFLFPPICWAVLAFMVWAVVRYLQADIEYVARWELMRILTYGVLFFAIINNLHRQNHAQIIALTLIFLGMALSMYAGVQFLQKDAHVWTLPTSYPGRGSGTFVYPNHLAGFLELLIPLGMCYVLMGRFSHVTKIIVGYASVIMLLGVGVTVSRGGWLATGAELAILCGVLLTQRDFRIQGTGLLVLLVLGGVLIIPRAQRMHDRVEKMVESGKADDMRFAIWRPTVRMWEDNLWLGVGPGEFDYRFPAYRPPEIQLRPAHAHNDYLNALAEWGIIGTAIVASAWALLVWGVIRNWKAVRGPRDDFSRKKSNKFAFLIGASTGLAAILLHSIVDFEMQLPAIAIIAVTWMALLSSQCRFATERFWFRAGPVLKCIATVLLLASIGYLGFTGVRAAREYRWLRQAERLAGPESENDHTYARIAALEKAFAIDPKNFMTAYDIGEAYRLKSWDGPDDFTDLAKKAFDWYQRSAKLDPYNPDNWLRMGMCLDWINTGPGSGQNVSEKYYQQANELDPNNYYITVNTGWHYVQIGDLAAARTWFERSTQLEWKGPVNEIAYNYLPIVDQRLKEAAQKQNKVISSQNDVSAPENSSHNSR